MTIPDHLKHLTFDPLTFYKLKGGKKSKQVNWAINDDGIISLCRQAGVQQQDVEMQHFVVTDKKTQCVVRVTLIINDRRWEAIASVSSSEFEKNDWDDRRRFHLAQMAMTRAKNNALTNALGITNADVNTIAEHLGIKDDTNTWQDDDVVPDAPEKDEESEVQESPEEVQKRQDAMRARMKEMKK